MASQVKNKIAGLLWLGYFILSIGIVGGVLAYGVATPFYLMGRFYKPADRWATAVTCFGIQLLLRVQPWLHTDVHFPNEEHTQFPPASGCLYVSNHRSHLDAFLLLAHLRGIRIFAKAVLFKIPFLGFMMWVMRQIPAPKNQVKFVDAIEKIKMRLCEGERVHVFPEMSRCAPGFMGVGPFAHFPFHVAYQLRLKVVPVAFKNTDHAWPKGTVGLISGAKVGMCVLAPVSSTDFASALELREHVHALIVKEVLLP